MRNEPDGPSAPQSPSRLPAPPRWSKAVRRCAWVLAIAAGALVPGCGGGGGGGSSVPTTPLLWNSGTWDQVRWN
jgi:hypothetical protein